MTPTRNGPETIRFVLSEVQHFRKLTRDDLKSLHWRDGLSMLPHPTGEGHILCGASAAAALSALASAALSRSRFAGRIAVERVDKSLGEERVRRFVRDGRPITSKECSDMTRNALASAAASIGPRTHFIACHITSDPEPRSFAVGPVQFRKREDSIAELQPRLDAYAAEEGREHRE